MIKIVGANIRKMRKLKKLHYKKNFPQRLVLCGKKCMLRHVYHVTNFLNIKLINVSLSHEKSDIFYKKNL